MPALRDSSTIQFFLSPELNTKCNKGREIELDGNRLCGKNNSQRISTAEIPPICDSNIQRTKGAMT
jgi:hypothetical protein